MTAATLSEMLDRVHSAGDLAALMSSLHSIADVVSGIACQPRFQNTSEECPTPAGEVLQRLLRIVHDLQDDARAAMEILPVLAGHPQSEKAAALVAARALDFGLEHHELAAYAAQISADVDQQAGVYRRIRPRAAR